MALTRLRTGGIAANAIVAASIAPGAVEITDIADNAITTAKLAANAVTSAKIEANAIEQSLADNSVTLFFRNRIINGDMRIDQRNAGANVTVNSGSAFFPVDRMACYGQATDGVFTAQQDSSAPAGFINSVKITTTTADASIGASQRYIFRHNIEGTNIADVGFGTANAKTVTISFWVRSSLTGTFGGSLVNSAQDRAYPFSYTISVADTWEYKTVTIAGDTSGTWLTTTGIGIAVGFDLGCGSDLKGTANAWTGSVKWGVTGGVDIIATLNATWYITGVQLEVGSVATPFERRPYGTELALCQRYFEKSYRQTTAVGATSSEGYTASPVSSNTVPAGQVYSQVSFAVVKRATPTITSYGFQGGAGKVSNASDGTDLAAGSGTSNSVSTQGFNTRNDSGGTISTLLFGIIYHWTADNEL